MPTCNSGILGSVTVCASRRDQSIEENQGDILALAKVSLSAGFFSSRPVSNSRSAWWEDGGEMQRARSKDTPDIKREREIRGRTTGRGSAGTRGRLPSTTS